MRTTQLSDAELLALLEQLCKSMNGPAMARATALLNDVSDGLVSDADRQVFDDATHRATDRVLLWEERLAELHRAGVTMQRSTDADFPVNLSLIHDQPPVLFVRGELSDRDTRSVAVVGTRSASEAGQRAATSVASELASAGVTVLSGLAKGIDTAAHSAALNAGGRTIAVYGTTIDRVYPRENRALAANLSAAVSQFLPGIPTGPWAFPARNITMSGLGLGTVVVEAGETSGARLQAEAALRHGKNVYLIDELVMHQPWATAIVDHPLVTVCRGAGEVLASLDQLLAAPELV